MKKNAYMPMKMKILSIFFISNHDDKKKDLHCSNVRHILHNIILYIDISGNKINKSEIS